jgi:hypothetical protein
MTSVPTVATMVQQRPQFPLSQQCVSTMTLVPTVTMCSDNDPRSCGKNGPIRCSLLTLECEEHLQGNEGHVYPVGISESGI